MKSQQITEPRPRGDRRGPLRVCMVHYSDFVVDSRIQRQARALAERGDRVDCVCLNDAEEIGVGEGTIALHRAAAGKPRGGKRAYLEGNARFLAGAARKVSALDRQQPFDLIEVHNMPDALVFTALRPKLRGTPLILNFHDTFPELFATLFNRPPNHPLVRLIRAEERVSAALADGHVFVTAEARDLLRDRGVTAERTQIVMNTPDERVFGERRVPLKPPAEGTLRVVYHGGLAERFGVEVLVRAVAMLRGRGVPVELDVYGSDAEAARQLAAVASQVAPEGVRIAPRPTPVEEIPGRLAQAHLGVVPTLRDDFTELLLPVKLLEYVHMGLPVVASRLPVIERYFGDDVLLAEPGDPASIAAAIEGVRAEPELARMRAEAASTQLAEIEWRRQREQYLELVDGLVERARSN
ncbi:MAG TPA: glycosyltransferase family 4 protein [Solirubrobacterales bacterium]|nr:glycosyltransferase family 4 protein [Solirubrobacterales bacterium]